MKLRNIRKTYHNRNNDVQALKGISLDLDTNGITVILGPSGCGKTTILSLIAGLLEPTKGEILLDGESVKNANNYSLLYIIYGKITIGIED